MRRLSNQSWRKRRFTGAIVITLTLALALLGILWVLPAPAQATLSMGQESAEPAAQNALQYVLIGWNDLGMHCMNQWFKNLAVLPPFNTLWAQVIVRADPPQVVTSGVNISYSVKDNTYSVGKTDFWTYAPQLFGPLADNTGLAGKKLADTMDPASDHFTAVGVPLTPFLDSSPTVLYPYNLVNLVAKDGSGNVLAQTTMVAPVSTEMHCEYCHADGGDPGGSTGNVYTNILTSHDAEEGTTLMSQQPVLCAKCHADNALNAPGTPGVPNLSNAMHGAHGGEQGNTPTRFVSKAAAGQPICYNCHPGPQTQCLRDVMYQHGMTCTDCHGGMAQVANPQRRPWIDLPRCGTCHGTKFAENANTRYRDSKGHGGLYCEACHNSTHAIVPSTQYNDNIQTVALQGYAGALGKCTVCHLTQPTGAGPHGLVVPKSPTLRSPKNGASVKTNRVTLNWTSVPNKTSYNIEIRQGSTTGQVVSRGNTTAVTFKTPKLTGLGTKYFWHVQACNLNLCSDWSPFWSFTIATTKATEGLDTSD